MPKFFDCHSIAPIVGEECGDMCDAPCSLHVKCRICGFEVDGNAKKEIVKCVKCSALCHNTCVAKLFLKKSSFACDSISRHLGKGGSEVPGPSGPRPLPPLRRIQMCLVCGDKAIAGCEGVWMCSEKCNFVVHERCMKLSVKLGGGVGSSMDGFKCEDVKFQIRPHEVEVCMKAGCENSVIERVTRLVKARGRVNVLGYNNYTKRYLNEDLKCNLCGRMVGLNERDHLMRYCSSVEASPITERNQNYPMSRVKRLRAWVFTDHYK